jgi:hypothetical protein
VIVRDGKDSARRWVTEEASMLPGVEGAFFHGSATEMPDDAPLPVASDVDALVVLGDPVPPVKLGKMPYRGVLLDVSALPGNDLQSPDQVLGRYDPAGSFRRPSVISDPTGRLGALRAAVSRDFAKRRWVARRCAHARERVLRHLQSADAAAPFHDRVTAWLFATGVTTHILLVAGLRNPTVRRRYAATRDLLADYGHLGFFETLL